MGTLFALLLLVCVLYLLLSMTGHKNRAHHGHARPRAYMITNCRFAHIHPA